MNDFIKYEYKNYMGITYKTKLEHKNNFLFKYLAFYITSYICNGYMKLKCVKLQS